MFGQFVTKTMDLSNYLIPTQPLPITGDIFRWCADHDIVNRFFLVVQVFPPIIKLSTNLSHTSVTTFYSDYCIVCVRFLWDDKTCSFSKWERIVLREKYFRSALEDAYPQKFIAMGHVSDLCLNNPEMSFIIKTWIRKNAEGEWCLA